MIACPPFGLRDRKYDPEMVTVSVKPRLMRPTSVKPRLMRPTEARLLPGPGGRQFLPTNEAMGSRRFSRGSCPRTLLCKETRRGCSGGHGSVVSVLSLNLAMIYGTIISGPASGASLN